MTQEELRRKARGIVASVADSPEGRLKLREEFYLTYGHGSIERYGYGESELDFIRWEMRRGVLNPVNDPRQPGSPWWRAVNGALLYYSELAALAETNTETFAAWEWPVQAWLNYIHAPSATSWYIAHNAGISQGYLEGRGLIQNETLVEQVFSNIVLYRLYFAQALVEDDSIFGEVGKILGNPELFGVDLITHLSQFYPDNYPLRPAQMEDILGDDWGFEEMGINLLDDELILPHLAALYQNAAQWNQTPEIAGLQVGGRPAYPNASVSPYFKVKRPAPAAKPQQQTQQGPMTQQKIAILGGGIAALSTAFELTSRDNWQAQYDITLYQLGWRLGGKARGGRGIMGRTEELGLHLLLGWYNNAFPMFRQVYQERAAKNLAPESPYQTLESVTHKNNATILTEFLPNQGGWKAWPLVFPEGSGIPGDGVPPSDYEMLKRGVGLLLETLLGSPYAKGIAKQIKWILDHFFPPDGAAKAGATAQPAPPESRPMWLDRFRDLVAELSPLPLQPLEAAISAQAHRIEKVWQSLQTKTETLEQEMFPEVLAFLEEAYKMFEKAADDLTEIDDHLRHLLIMFSLGKAMLKGILADVWDWSTFSMNYAAINNQDFRAWLAKHGASEQALASPAVGFFFKGTFEGLADQNQQGGLLAAGTAIQFLLPALGYQQSFCYQLKLGTADSLVMPLYQVLAARGVKFEFFHQVDAVKSQGTGLIQEIDLIRQVDLIQGSYQPEILVKGTPCWPTEPLYDQIQPDQAKALQAGNIDLESPWSGWQGVGRRTLKKGQDFDQVFLGIPVKALQPICQELMAETPAWKNMVEQLDTAQVMSAQFWFDKTMEEMGYHNNAWGMGEHHCALNVATYANPMFSLLDQTQIIETEAWPLENVPKAMIMFTGTLPDPLEWPPFTQIGYQERVVEQVRNLTWQWAMDNLGWFFQKSAPLAYPNGIYMQNLTNCQAGDWGAKQGLANFRSQFFTAAVAPADRYVIATPNTAQYRLKPGNSGYGNLFLVGDWTDYGTNIGYMEGCVVSAKEAVEAYLGQG